jgi:hypothetical protein
MPMAPDTVTLYGADGAPIEALPHEGFDTGELWLLAEYKKFLAKRGYREALYCQHCWSKDLSDGCEAHVKTSGLTVEALIKCRCRVAYGKGSGIAQ